MPRNINKEILKRREKAIEEMEKIWPPQKKKKKPKLKIEYGLTNCPECQKQFHKQKLNQVCCSFECQFKRTVKLKKEYALLVKKKRGKING